MTDMVDIMPLIKWARIEDLPSDWKRLIRSDLNSLASIWKERANELKTSGALKEFNARLAREWAIETGIVEKIYSIERGVTLVLIEKGIHESLIPHGSTDRPAADIVKILRDHQEALEGLFDFVTQRRKLSTSYIKELHQCLTRHQETCHAIDQFGKIVNAPLLRGEWKKTPNNPTRPQNGGEVHEYCPPEHVSSEMDQFIALHKQHEDINVPPEIESAWLHHRFTQIHPFQDGNGRVARSLASLILIRGGWFPLVVSGEPHQKAKYIDALEKSDRGDLSALINLISHEQKKAFMRSLSLSDDVLGKEGLEKAKPEKVLIYAAKERLVTRKKKQTQELKAKLFPISNKLETQALKRFDALAKDLNKEFRAVDKSFNAKSERNTSGNSFWFAGQVFEAAKLLGYYADTRTYRRWIRLKIKLDRQAELVLSFHSLGFEFVGVMAVSAFIAYRDKQEEGEVTVSAPTPLSDGCFQFSYNENEKTVTDRFALWLNDIVVVGLDHWRRQI